MKTPTQGLMDDHVVIVRMLDVVEAAAERIAAGGGLPGGWWDEVIAWLRTFADRNHHAKEEKALFPAMVKAGLPSQGGPIAVMLAEHDQGRDLIQAMAAGEAAQRSANARHYVRLLRQHIDKENGILFPLADSVLDDQARLAVAREFEAVEAVMGRDGSLPHAEAAVARLAAALG